MYCAYRNKGQGRISLGVNFLDSFFFLQLLKHFHHSFLWNYTRGKKKRNSCILECLRKLLTFYIFYISYDELTIFAVSLLLKTSFEIMRYMSYMKITLNQSM